MKLARLSGVKKFTKRIDGRCLCASLYFDSAILHKSDRLGNKNTPIGHGGLEA